ncbi:hypothetical protein [Streptomyces sp. NPDC059893]|uniref:hypothetical protein n=1 Tax=Streptomyces sp. NPDC059893 TaxID=3346990 RepID=UPI003661A8A4
MAATRGSRRRPGCAEPRPHETLRSLTHHRGYAAAPQAMSPHRHSVRYRMQQATALLPHSAHGLRDDFDARAARRVLAGRRVLT